MFMSALGFDTLKFTKTLIGAGFAAEQAEAVAVAFRDASSDADVATKKDIALAVAELKGEMGTMRWMLGATLALAVANFARQYF
jgi:aminoglycoside phosphotransferase